MVPALRSGGLGIKDYFFILFKRRWTVASFFIIVVTSVIFWSLVQTPIYRAETVIQIDSDAPNIVSFKEVVALGTQNYYSSRIYYETQFYIIKSRSIAQKVIDRLGLKNKPPFSTEKDPVQALIDRIEVDPIKTSQLVKVSIFHRDRKLAALICDTLADVYMFENIQRKLDANKGAIEWLKDEQNQLKDRVKESEQNLHNFMLASNIASFEERQNIIYQKLQDLSKSLTDSQRERIASEALYNQAQSLFNAGKAQELQEVIQNRLVSDLKNERVMAEKKYAELSAKYKPDHPEMQKLDNQIAELNKKIDEEINNIMGGIRSDYLVKVDKEEALTLAVEQAKIEALDLNKLEIDYKVLKRNAESDSKLFEELNKRSKETQVTESLRANNIRVIDRAKVPDLPVKPKRRTNAMLAAVLGLIGGIGLAFLLEYMDTTIKTQYDVEQLGLPFLGVIPSFNTEGMEEESSQLFSHRYPKSTVTESMRSIRTNITFAAASNRSLSKLLITSPGPKEGKSTTVINLGIIFAQGGRKILLVDSDLRRPRLHKEFNISRDVGLTNLLMNEVTIEQAAQKTEIENLWLIPCGPIPPNPSELLGAERMAALVQQLTPKFDLILFDSPPVIAVTDAVVLSRLMDGVILIVKSGRTNIDSAYQAKRLITDVGATVLGIVLNDFNIRGEGYRYYYYYYYYYRSEDGDDEKVVRRRRSPRSRRKKSQTT